MNPFKKILLIIVILSFLSCSQRKFIYPQLSYTTTHLSFTELDQRYKHVLINKSQKVDRFVHSVKAIDCSNFLLTKTGYNYFQVFIDENGNVESVFLIKSFNKEFDQLAIDAIINSKFKPLKFHGKKSKYSIFVHYPFYENAKIYPIINGIWTDPNYLKMNANHKNSSLTTASSPLYELPKLLIKAPPIYPLIARQAGVEGTVELMVKVNENGKVVKVSVIKSVPMLDKAAIDAAFKCIFKPATKNGRPVKGTTFISYKFGLK